MINGADTTEVGNVSLAEKKKNQKTKEKQNKTKQNKNKAKH